MIWENSTSFHLNDSSELAEPLVDCRQLKAISVYCVLLFISSVLFNSLLIAVFIKYKELRSCLNLFIFAISFCNLISSLLELPVVIITNFYCR